jgi:hypothetical protein
LIGYQKLELGDEIGKHLLSCLKNITDEEFTLNHAKLLHTLSNYEERVTISSQEEINSIANMVFTLYKKDLPKLSINSICLGLHALYKLNKQLLTKDLIIEA